MEPAKLAEQIREEYIIISLIQATLKKLWNEKPGNWKTDYIGNRRELSAAYGRLTNISHALLPLMPDAPPAKAFRDALAQMRHKTAVHQASWPVATIEAETDGYEESLGQVEASNAQFQTATEAFLRWAAQHDGSI